MTFSFCIFVSSSSSLYFFYKMFNLIFSHYKISFKLYNLKYNIEAEIAIHKFSSSLSLIIIPHG